MKYALIAGLVLAAFASTAQAAEDWLVTGGDGSAFAYDRGAMVKTGAQTSLRYGVYSATAMPPPAALAGSSLFGFTGQMIVNCTDKSTKLGETTYYFAYGGERTVAADPKAVFEKPKAGDYRQYFIEVICAGRRTMDTYFAKTRADAVAQMKRVSGLTHVTNVGGKGWTFALGDAGRLLAIDTTTTKRTGDIVMQSEINWMRKPQVTNGETWRYLQMTFEYDCAKGQRRGSGPLRIYADDDHTIHEETVANAPWEPVAAGGPAATLLEIACKSRKLAGLPTGPRAAMLVRLKELNAIQ